MRDLQLLRWKKKSSFFFFLFLLPRGLRQPVRSSRWLADVEVNIPHAFCHRRSNQRSTLTRVFRPLTPPRTARSTKILKFREFCCFPNLTLNSIKIHRIQRAKKLKFCQKNRPITWNFEQVSETCALLALNVWPYFINVLLSLVICCKSRKKIRKKKTVCTSPLVETAPRWPKHKRGLRYGDFLP